MSRGHPHRPAGPSSRDRPALGSRGMCAAGGCCGFFAAADSRPNGEEGIDACPGRSKFSAEKENEDGWSSVVAGATEVRSS